MGHVVGEVLPRTSSPEVWHPGDWLSRHQSVGPSKQWKYNHFVRLWNKPYNVIFRFGSTSLKKMWLNLLFKKKDANTWVSILSFLLQEGNDRTVKDADGWGRNLGRDKGSGISFPSVSAATIPISLAYPGQGLTFLKRFLKLSRELYASATHCPAFLKAHIINSFHHSFSKLLLNAYYVQGTRSSWMGTKWTTFLQNSTLSFYKFFIHLLYIIYILYRYRHNYISSS